MSVLRRSFYSGTPVTRGKYIIVMVRHGESEWNRKNLFCGWYDANLSEKGREEAKRAGEALRSAKFTFDIAFTSFLTRAQTTLWIILKQMNLKIPVVKTWRLNERHYGALTGMDKAQTAKQYGEDQVKIWRRSYDIPPPPILPDHPYYKAIVDDPRYEGILSPSSFPKFESLKLTIKRTLPYWNEIIVPEMKDGRKILIAAHGNSLRGIIKHLDQISDKDIMGLNLPTGIPFVYSLNECIKPEPKGSLQFIGDPVTVKKAIESVANQGKAK